VAIFTGGGPSAAPIAANEAGRPAKINRDVPLKQ
jgi:hypothetical protein